MKKIKRTMLTSVVFIGLLLQTGCWDQKLFEEIGFVLEMGLELNGEGALTFSVSVPAVSPNTESHTKFLTTSSENLIRSSREKLRDVAGRQLQGGKIQFIYFSKDLAKIGINEFLEIFFRDPENPLLANMIVVDGSPKEMMELSKEFKDRPRPSYYVANLLVDARSRFTIPETRVFNFSILYHSKTIDPATPLFKYSNKSIETAGAALFSGDKMVGEINTEQTKLLCVLMGLKATIEYFYEGDEIQKSEKMIMSGAAVKLKNSKPKIEIDTSGDAPIINIKVKFKGVLDEYTGEHNLDQLENQNKFESTIEESLEEDFVSLIEYLQKVGSDPVGFGEIIRVKQNAYWKQVEWKDVFKGAEIKVDVEMVLESYGTIN